MPRTGRGRNGATGAGLLPFSVRESRNPLSSFCLLDFAGATHHLLILLDAFFHGLVDLVPFLAFLQFEIIRGVCCKGQFFGSLGQQERGDSTTVAVLPNSEPVTAEETVVSRDVGCTWECWMEKSMLMANCASDPVKNVGNTICYMPESCHMFLVA